MTGKRLRLDDDERVYLIDLVKENTKLQGSLISLSLRKLLSKLGDDTLKASKARDIPSSPRKCLEGGCGKVTRNGAGLYRHTISKHNRPPTEEEKSALQATQQQPSGEVSDD